MQEHLLVSEPKQFQYQLIADVHKQAVTNFPHREKTYKDAFFESFLRTSEPGHGNAYDLCALANTFPHQLVKDETVIAKKEIVLSEDTDGAGWTETVQNLRDALLNFVNWNKDLLIKRAKQNLTDAGIV